jgi:hypothetical protein
VLVDEFVHGVPSREKLLRAAVYDRRFADNNPQGRLTES